MVEHVESREAEEERERRDALRAQEVQRLEVLARLAGGIAHDFNNLLTAVLTGADVLAEEIGDRVPGAQDTVDSIRRAGLRAAVLCRQLLALSGRSRFSMAPVDLGETVAAAVRALRPSLDPRHVVDVSAGAGRGAVVADDAQLQLLVTNLVLNASEALGERAGRIAVHVESVVVVAALLAEAHVGSELAPGPAVRLSVSDDGPGIAEGVLGRLFEPYVTTRTAGRGLGLAAVLGVVRGHGGAIRVRSRAGEGTVIEVFLPTSTAVAPARTWPPPPAVASGGELVLVVDDEPLVRAAVCRVLRSRGFTTLEAPDGAAGVELFRAHASRVAVVLLDLSMPEMDGVEALNQIRAIRPGAPAVIMSGYSEDETAARFVGVGLAPFLAKPFAPDEMVRKLRAAILGRS